MNVVTLEATDVQAYRELMLEAYEFAADAFTSTATESRAEPDAWWIKRIGSISSQTTSVGVWDKGTLIGTVAVEYSTKPKTHHKALVIGMFVKPAYRSKGVGRLLMTRLIEIVVKRPEVELLSLTLTEGNEPALRLYRSVGFSVWGVEPHAIRTDSGFKGKVHMSLALQPANVDSRSNGDLGVVQL